MKKHIKVIVDGVYIGTFPEGSSQYAKFYKMKILAGISLEYVYQPKAKKTKTLRIKPIQLTLPGVPL